MWTIQAESPGGLLLKSLHYDGRGDTVQMALHAEFGEGRNHEPLVCISSTQLHSSMQTSLAQLLVSKHMKGLISGRTEAKHVALTENTLLSQSSPQDQRGEVLYLR